MSIYSYTPKPTLNKTTYGYQVSKKNGNWIAHLALKVEVRLVGVMECIAYRELTKDKVIKSILLFPRFS